MILVLVLTLLLLGIVVFQSMQGALSAMILFLLTILSAAIAFGFYEPLGNLVIDRIGALAHPSAMIVLFVVPLVVLRGLYDWKLSGNVVLGLWPDRIGGALFGFFTGLLMVGMLSIIMQMLPFPSAVLGYESYKSDLQEGDGLTPKWAADFTLGLMRHLSANSLSAMSDDAVSYETAHKDLLLESFGLRNRPSGGSADAGPKSCQVLGFYSLAEQEGSEKFKDDEATRQRLFEDAPAYPLSDRSHASKVYVARLAIADDAADTDGWYRLPATHFRLVTNNGNMYYPVGYLTFVGAWRINPTSGGDKAVKVGDILVARPKKGSRLLVDWVYRLPDNEKPEYLVFRNSNSLAVPAVVAGLPAGSDKSGQLALGMKPVSGKINFSASGGKKLLQPETMEFSNKFDGNLPEFIGEEGRPEEIKDMRTENKRIRSAVVDGLLQQIVNKGSKVRANELNVLAAPTGENLVQVNFKVNTVGSSEEIKAKLAGFKPCVLLSDGKVVGAAGTLVYSDAAGNDRQIYLSYDADKAPKPNEPAPAIAPDVVDAIMKQLSRNPHCIFYFGVPAGEFSVVAVKLGPDAEFYPEAPLAQ